MLFHTLKHTINPSHIVTRSLIGINARNYSSLFTNYRKFIWNLEYIGSNKYIGPFSQHGHTDSEITLNPSIYSQTRGPKIVKPRDIIKRWKIRPGDKVVVISGKDKGKVGEVLMCDKLRNQVKVKGCNMRKMIVDSEVVQIEKKIHYSNVQLVDKLLNVGTRVSIRYTQDNRPLRVSKKSGYVMPWPEKKRKEPRDPVEGEKDTKPEEALRRTYDYHKDILSMNLLRQTMSKYNREIT